MALKVWFGPATAVGLLVLLLSGCGDGKATSASKAGSGASSAAGLSEDPRPQIPSKPPIVEKAALHDFPVPELSVGEPSNENVVTVAAAVSPGELFAGASAMLFLKAKALKGWHIYAADKPTGTNIPTSIRCELPKGVETDGKWRFPEAKKNDKAPEETWEYGGEMVFQLPLKLVQAGTGNAKIELKYQACNDEVCKPPATATVEIELTVKPGR